MDPLLRQAAAYLHRGDALAALQLTAQREDPLALALRGLALAQMGDWHTALARVREAIAAMADPCAREAAGIRSLDAARCELAAAELALACRAALPEGEWFSALAESLRSAGDQHNAIYAEHLAIRRYLLGGAVGKAASLISALEKDGRDAHSPRPPLLSALVALDAAEVAMRRGGIQRAETLLLQAAEHAASAQRPQLATEIVAAHARLDHPAARRCQGTAERPISLRELAALRDARQVFVDRCRRRLIHGEESLLLAKRPLLFQLLFILGRAFPSAATREALVAEAFASRICDDSHRVRLRVEIGRLRKLLPANLTISATEDGFVLVLSGSANAVLVIAPLSRGPVDVISALMSDGVPWSSQALSEATSMGQRSVQRSLRELAAGGRILSIGDGPQRRWVAPAFPGIAPTLLLPLLDVNG